MERRRRAVVGASFPVSEALVDYPYATGQMIRYAAGALILTALLKGRLGRPSLKELGLLALVAAIGMAGFNLAVLGAVDHIGATNTGVIIGASPVILALAGRTRRILIAAGIVVAGAALVNGADSRISGARARRSRSPASAARSASRCSPRRCSPASARCGSPPGRRSWPPSSSRSSPEATSRRRPRPKPPRSPTSR